MLKAKHHSVRIFVLFIFFLLILPIVFSQPWLDVQTSEETNTLTIVYPKTEIYDAKNITLNFDVLNATYSKLDNTQVDCNIVIVDESGKSILSSSLDYSSYWYLDYNNPTEGIYNYYVHCNNSVNGFVSSAFEIREGGTQLYNSPESWLSIIIGLGIFIISILLISFNIKEPLLSAVKSLCFLLGIVDSFLLFLFIWMVSNNPINPSISNPLVLGFLISHGIALIALIWMYAHFLIERNMRGLQDD